MVDASKPKRRMGFAVISPERRREISSQGGKAAHAAGRAHTWSSAEAREAGRLGGLAAHRKGPLPTVDEERAAAIEAEGAFDEGPVR